MRFVLALTVVIALTTAALGQSAKAGESLDLTTDSEAHAIYAAVVPDMWANGWRPNDPVVLQRETEDVAAMSGRCASYVPSTNPEWVEVQKHFLQENARRKVLPVALPIRKIYRLVSLAEIERIDVPLKRKYPENYNEQTAAFQFVAVSAIGFNADKTKAMVYVRLRNRGQFAGLERREGKWITAPNSSICTWIA